MTLAGTVLEDRYRLIEGLGEGGLAVVYRARDELLDRDVAVKILRPQFAADPEFVQRFRQEARSAAALAHPNIAAVFDSGFQHELQFIVMQLIDGPNLEQVLAERGRLPVAEALRIVMAAAEALQAAHERGIVHRDVKPGNILLTADGSVRVVDFGIARALSDVRMTTPGLLLGSVQYCSPEQVLGEDVGPPSDVYSLGIVLYELLTGVSPFQGSTPASVALARVQDEPTPPSELVPDLPAGIDELVMGALARSPAARYASGLAFAGAIRDWWRSSRPEPAAAAVPRTVNPRAIRGRRQALPPTTVGIPAAASADAATARTQIAGQRQDDDDPRRVLGVIIPLAALLFVAMGLWVLAPHGGRGGGVLAATSSPRGSAAALRTASPVPAVLPSSTRGTSAAAATPAPTAAATPAPTPRPTARATPAPAALTAPARTPAQTVARFYQLVAAHDFSAAARLWSARMRANYPPRIYIDRRFGHTTGIVLNRDRTTSMSLAAGTAVVAVDLTEYRDVGPSPRRWVGRWDLVLTPGGWLLDQPHF
jgi:serine/threonine-protein kinase